jgi:hypothetical protein
MILAGTYFRQPLEEGHELKISKGGFMGATFRAKWGADRTATFLTVGNAGLADVPFQSGQVTVGFASGKINYMDDGLGYLLIRFLRKSE